MTTLSALISDCRNDYLRAGRPEKINKLSANIDASVTTLVTTYDLNINPGAKFSLGLEDLHAWTTTP